MFCKKIIFPLLACGVMIFSATTYADANMNAQHGVTAEHSEQEGVNYISERIESEKVRIKNTEEKGLLTNEEAAHMRSQLADLEKEEQERLNQNKGLLSKEDENDFENKLNMISHGIKHDEEERW